MSQTNEEVLLCEECETEIVDGLGCQCGAYEPGFDKVADRVFRRTGYEVERS